MRKQEPSEYKRILRKEMLRKRTGTELLLGQRQPNVKKRQHYRRQVLLSIPAHPCARGRNSQGQNRCGAIRTG